MLKRKYYLVPVAAFIFLNTACADKSYYSEQSYSGSYPEKITSTVPSYNSAYMINSYVANKTGNYGIYPSGQVSYGQPKYSVQASNSSNNIMSQQMEYYYAY